ncbi:hypothetical protein B0H11DRAFT_2236379 [Mycena galericulata]|nr:hypothetical protein B0H11DRAFT_2236379 [Mycena galericulata]
MSSQPLPTPLTAAQTEDLTWTPDSKWWLVGRQYITRDRDFVDTMTGRGISAYARTSFHGAVFCFRELNEMEVDTLAWYVLSNGLFTTDAQEACVAYKKVEKRKTVVFVSSDYRLFYLPPWCRVLYSDLCLGMPIGSPQRPALRISTVFLGRKHPSPSSTDSMPSLMSAVPSSDNDLPPWLSGVHAAKERFTPNSGPIGSSSNSVVDADCGEIMVPVSYAGMVARDLAVSYDISCQWRALVEQRILPVVVIKQ